MRKKFFIFALQLGKKAMDDDLFALSNELAYKILLSFFPFLVFLVSLLGFLRLEDSPVVAELFETLPEDVSAMIENFISGIQAQPSRGLLSASLLVSIYSASNGFRAIIKGINKAHGQKDDRSWIKNTGLCAVLMLIFTFSILVMLSLWIFSNAIFSRLPYHFISARLISAIIALVILTVTTALMYRLTCARRIRGRILPGACATVALWAISSNIFAVFIGHFSNISVFYGSIAGVFILIMWLNLISFFLLLGNSVNALLDKRSKQ